MPLFTLCGAAAWCPELSAASSHETTSSGTIIFAVLAAVFAAAAAAALVRIHFLKQALSKSDKKTTDTEHLFTQTLDALPVYVYVEDVNNGFRHVRCNKICSELWGRPIEDVIGRSDEELFEDSSELRKFRETDLATVKSMQPRVDVLPFTGADGKQHVGRFYRRCLNLPGGRRWLVGIVMDITEENDRRTRLDAAMKVFDYTFDMTKTAIFRVDLETREMTGASNLNTLWPIVDGKGLPRSEVVYREDQAHFSAALNDLVLGHRKQNIVDYRSRYFGTMRYYRLEAGMDLMTGGKPTIIGIIQDITDQTLKEREHRETANLLNVTVNSIPVILFIKDTGRDFRYVMVNQAFEDFFGLKSEEIIGKTDAEILHAGRISVFWENDRAAMNLPEGEQLPLIETVVGADGKEHIFNVRKHIITGQHGQLLLLGVAMDVTVQTDLLDNQMALNACFRSALSMNLLTDNIAMPVMKLICQRLKASRCYLLRHDEAAGKVYPECEYHEEKQRPVLNQLGEYDLNPNDAWYKIIDAGAIIDAADVSAPDAAKTFGMWAKVHKQYGVKSLYGCRVSTGGSMWGNFGVSYEDAPHLLSDTEKEFFISGAHLLGLMLERQQEHRKLQESLKALNIAGNQAKFGERLTQSAFFLANADCRFSNETDNFKMLVPSQNGVILHPDQWIVPEDAAAVQEKLDQLSSGTASNAAITFRSDYFGERRFYRVFLTRNAGSGEREFFCAIQNVTEIAENSAKLKESQALWEQIINVVPMTIFAKDANDHFRYILCNSAYAAFLGRKQNDIIGKTDEDLFPPDEAKRCRAKDEEIMASGAAVSFEEEATDGNGMIRYFRATRMPFAGLNGQKLLVAANSDITEQQNLLRFERVNSQVLSYTVSEPAFRAVVTKILETMLQVLHADRVIFTVRDGGGALRYYDDRYSSGHEPLAKTDVEAHEKMWNSHIGVFMRNSCLFYEDIRKVPETAEFFLAHENYPTQSYAAAPVYVGNELFGVLMVSFIRRYSFRATDEMLMRAMSNIIVLARIREQQTEIVRAAEQHNQIILDHINVPLWLFDAQGRIVKFNKASIEAAGISQYDTEHGFACRELFQCGKSEEECPVRLAIQDGKPHQAMHRYQISSRDYMIDVRPILDESGRVKYLVKSAIDITQLNVLLANYRVVNDCLENIIREGDMHHAIEMSLKEITDHVAANRCYIFQFDTEHKTISSYIEYAETGRASILSRYKNQPYSAKPDWETLFAASRILSFPDLQNTMIRDGLAGWEDAIMEHDIRSLYACRIVLDGKFWGYVGLAYEKKPHILSREEQDFFLSVAHSVELMLVRKKFQEEIFSAIDKAKANEKSKSLFLASMSHEIRTPLNAVIGFTELLKDVSLSTAEKRDFLEGISSAGHTLYSLINDVLDLSKLEAGQMVFTPADIDFEEMADEMKRIFQQTCEQKDIVFITDVPPDIPIFRADKLRLRQILFNLVGNAVKFTDSGSIEIRADFKVKDAKTGDFSFSVADTGCGIAPEDQAHVFNMFAQAKSQRDTAYAANGTGLGLPLVQKLAAGMHGKVSLKSSLRAGSTFTVELFDIPISKTRKIILNDPAPDISLPRIKEQTILVVDDVPTNLRVLAAMLEKLGGIAITASDAEEGWKIWEEAGDIDVVLTDLWLPGMNGADFALKLRHSGNHPGARIIAISADVECRDNFDLSPFDAYLYKPVSLEKLANVLDKG